MHNDLDRLLYVLLATALACVLLFDQTFAAKLSLAIANRTLPPLEGWEIALASLSYLLMLAILFVGRR